MTINSLFRKKNRIVLAKIESAYGTDPVPTVADNAIEVIDDIQFNENIDVIETNKVGSDKSKTEAISGKMSSEVNLNCYLTASGARGTKSRLEPLFKACGEEVTASAGVKVVNNPTNSNYSCTIYVYDVNPNGNYLLHKFIGCVGNVVREGKAGQLATVKFSMKGLYTKVSDVANPGTPVYDVVQPLTVKNAQITFGGETGLLVESFTLDNQNDLTERTSISAATSLEGYTITAFGPKLTINPEQTLVAEVDWKGKEENKTASAVKIELGDAEGNSIMMSASKAIPEAVKYTERNGLLALDVVLRLSKTNGNDQFHTVET